MALTISSDARWASATWPGHEPVLSVPAAPASPDSFSPKTSASVSHRLRRRLGRKCASVLAGASMGLGLTAARIPTASAQVGISQSVPMGESARPAPIPVADQPP